MLLQTGLFVVTVVRLVPFLGKLSAVTRLAPPFLLHTFTAPNVDRMFSIFEWHQAWEMRSFSFVAVKNTVIGTKQIH